MLFVNLLSASHKRTVGFVFGTRVVWTIANRATVLNSADGPIVCRSHSRDVHLVMGSPTLDYYTLFV